MHLVAVYHPPISVDMHSAAIRLALEHASRGRMRHARMYIASLVGCALTEGHRLSAAMDCEEAIERSAHKLEVAICMGVRQVVGLIRWRRIVGLLQGIIISR